MEKREMPAYREPSPLLQPEGHNRKTRLMQKAKSRQSQRKLDKLIKRALAAYQAMTPEQRQQMLEEQRKSFVRGMTTPCEHGILDFETCPKCRGWES
jgi:Spy/CpxP family protein refolding chaperone